MNEEASEKNSRAATLAGVGVAAAGVSHFVAPQLYDDMTKAVFPTNTRQHIYIDGGIETALGVGLAIQKTRKLAVIGLIVYLLYLAGNVVRNR